MWQLIDFHCQDISQYECAQGWTFMKSREGRTVYGEVTAVFVQLLSLFPPGENSEVIGAFNENSRFMQLLLIKAFGWNPNASR